MLSLTGHCATDGKGFEKGYRDTLSRSEKGFKTGRRWKVLRSLELQCFCHIVGFCRDESSVFFAGRQGRPCTSDQISILNDILEKSAGEER